MSDDIVFLFILFFV